MSNSNTGSGSGSALPVPVLLSAGLCTLVAVFVSAVSIYLQLKNYRKPLLQRMVVRIMLMVPLYAIASLISLFSLEAAFVIDAIRDIYEAFVIYCFFSLLLSYLGGVRSLLILIHGRPPKTPPFPINIFKRELDVSDPHTFLSLKRGIIQYVQIKPILAAATLILKAFGKYNEGDFRANSGYLYVSIIYNISICLALYCLAMFWLCVSEDLKPFRPVPKFLCVKGILFFSFWQSIGISILVAANAITRLGPYTDAEHISVGLNDTLICIEMPFFALAHLYAFAYTDFLDPRLHFCARMSLRYALVDAFGIKDVVEDIKATLQGEGMDYREFEPAEGMMHKGSGRDRRIKAGLRYSKGGKKKYWLPRVQNEARLGGRIGRVVDGITGEVDDVHAPLLEGQADDVAHLAPDMLTSRDEPTVWDPIHRGLHVDSLGFEIPFGDVDPDDEELFDHCRHYVFGDYNYPVIDVSDEGARIAIWHEEERVLRNERGAWQSPIRNVRVGTRGKIWEGYGAVGATLQRRERRDSDSTSSLGLNKDMRTGAATPDEAKGGKAHLHDGDRGVRSSLQAPDLQRTKTGGSSAGSSVASSPGRYGTSTNGVASTSRLPTQLRQSPMGSRTSLSSMPGRSSASTPVKFKDEKSKSKSKHPARTHLPSDAVDLVVEDPEAALNERSRERVRGEPALRKGSIVDGLRRVYRRGFSLSQDEGQDEEGGKAIGHDPVTGKLEDAVEAWAGPAPAELEGDDEGKREGDERGAWERNSLSSPSPRLTPTTYPQEEIIIRAETPPVHIRMAYDEMEGHNPWA